MLPLSVRVRLLSTASRTALCRFQPDYAAFRVGFWVRAFSRDSIARTWALTRAAWVSLINVILVLGSVIEAGP
jgi:hypothetical protein